MGIDEVHGMWYVQNADRKPAKAQVHILKVLQLHPIVLFRLASTL